ncbi:DUF4097 family beta strand repeat protein [Streptomyces lunaelactis]|uniref:DUF4097 family beta strand repeat-containing protein n=1 Tax=Streptomyces lunaelactis TaxID=1535768 RepID=UPI001584DA14|nr:DUF4097 family beta strand repeat-containing protein [Streptomyces lunaelactis]NUK50397.1 DUF4097 family beta strand repeat protein [Streptomyces lunaelactis]
MTQKNRTAAHAGAIDLDVKVTGGRINVTVDPKATRAEVTVHTTDTEGPIADAVNNSAFTENGAKFSVVVPDDDTGGTVINAGGSVFSFGGNSMVIGNTSGVVISGGDITIGGRRIVSGGRVVADQGTLVSGSGTITIDVILPAGSSLSVNTKNAETTVRGDLQNLRFDARNGSVQAGGVASLEAETHNGSVLVDRVDTDMEASTHNGSITIGAYNGQRGATRTHNGDVTISATPASSGRLSARTHNGNIRVRGAGHLDLKTSTHNGRVW